MVDHRHGMKMHGCDWMRKAASGLRMCRAVLTAAEDAVRIAWGRCTHSWREGRPSTECAAGVCSGR